MHKDHLQNIIWREWRNSEDETYASRLYNLVADKPVGRGVKITIILLGTLYGMLFGFWLSLSPIVNWNPQLEEWSRDWIVSPTHIMVGSGLGVIAGLLIQLSLGRSLSWRIWLRRLATNLDPNSIFLLIGGGMSVLIALILAACRRENNVSFSPVKIDKLCQQISISCC